MLYKIYVAATRFDASGPHRARCVHNCSIIYVDYPLCIIFYAGFMHRHKIIARTVLSSAVRAPPGAGGARVRLGEGPCCGRPIGQPAVLGLGLPLGLHRTSCLLPTLPLHASYRVVMTLT